MRIWFKSARPGAGLILLLVLGALAVGCGGSEKPTLTIGTRDAPEEAILAEIYAQALEEAGYTVRKVVELGDDPAAAQEALERGRISGYPDHLSTVLTSSLERDLEAVPSDPRRAYQEAKDGLEKEGLTVFPPTPYSFTNAVGSLRKTAEELDLKTVSDLKGQSENLTVTGAAGCHGSVNCAGGLELRYGLAFGGFVYKNPLKTEPFYWLEHKLANLGMVPSTDGRLAAEKDKFVILEEDQDLFPAGNAILVTTTELVEEAGPEFEEAIVAAQRGLTLAVMQQLNAEVEIEKQDPANVAAKYLEQGGPRS